MDGDTAEPSLLRFVLERLEDDVGVILDNTPVFEEVGDSRFREQFLDRGALIDRGRLDRAVIQECVEAMVEVQGAPRVATPAGPPDPITVLGSQIIKLVASRYAWHPDYRAEWAPR